MHRMVTMLCRTLPCLAIVVIAHGDDEMSDGGGILVDRVFFLAWRMCPLAVATDFGRYLRTSLAVRPGHVA